MNGRGEWGRWGVGEWGCREVYLYYQRTEILMEMSEKDWKAALNRFAIIFGDRLPYV
jgi:hypothetical protein